MNVWAIVIVVIVVVIIGAIEVWIRLKQRKWDKKNKKGGEFSGSKGFYFN